MLTMLTSSREILHLRGEQEYPVPPLGLPDIRNLPPVAALSQYDAVALFIQRATLVRPEFEVTNANAAGVAICARLDGLPLAIELAAARVKLFAPDAILSRLEKSLSLLTGGARDLPPASRRSAAPSTGATTCWMRRSESCSGGCRSSAAAGRSTRPRRSATRPPTWGSM